MSTSGLHQELAFQDEIASHLEANGWLRSHNSAGYDKEHALFPEDLLGWLAETQPKEYEKIVAPGLTGEARSKAEARILDRVVKVLASDEAHGGGTLGVLRKGFDMVGLRHGFKTMQMPPADDRNPDLTARYAKNRLRVMQEVVYSQDKADRIDLVLFCNGLPVATIELKTDYTQSLEKGIAQYRTDRSPLNEPLLTEFRGALVHFVVTDTRVAMTTKLEGPATTFLPFDMGHDNGAGNPPGTGTSFFWKDVLDRDSWLAILAKFIYVSHETREDPLTGAVTEKRRIRFPRFHQWRAVTRLTEAARTEGPGHHYLIQHSAGSGKTDSIAWTAHRLATLHTPEGTKVFDTVIVIADRQVLDRQLQDAVDQLVTTTGTFQAVTRGSGGSKTKELTEALKAGVPIIGVTIQTFPYVLEAMKKAASDGEDTTIAGKRFAVIADEAHSSQSGEASAAVRKVVYLNDPAAGLDEDAEPGADQDALVAMAAKADADHRISFFAFTATPKAKTLEQFGRPGPDGKPVPFDLYSMKQAIEEGFILDVLKNYTTYERAARISLKTGGEDIEVDTRTGTKAYLTAVNLHPTNIDQKVREIIRHYRAAVQGELGGRAKAMVVTDSRAAAVKYARSFRRICAEENLDLQALVAFSGDVPDPEISVLPGGTAPTVTEASENPQLDGRDLAKVFARPDEHVLIVANKYQTGFDQPLLVGMYVDKQLSGIAAVQTLSRLNRMAPGKTDTYVLDFVNDPEQILAAFREYYEDAEITTESDPDLVMDLLAKLDQAGIHAPQDVDLFWEAWTRKGARHTDPERHLAPAIDRFADRWKHAIQTEDRTERDTLVDYRSTLAQYMKAYAFFSQLVDYGNPRFEKFSAYADLLARRLRSFTDEDPEPDDVDVSDIVLTHYRLEKIREDDLKLGEAEPEGLTGMTEAGMAAARERKRERKTEIIDKVNRYLGGLNVPDDYKISGVENLLAEVVADQTMQAISHSNSRVDFAEAPGFRTVAENAVWSVEESSGAVIKHMREMPWEELRGLLLDMGLYERLRDVG
ncbi:type I restriction endonuclease subunit R [Brachybacterium nesterenkovii]|uniref:Type I restriction-modification system, restriction subunit R n=1 Tax=Brachybacterium nesterenkovii TaxID=47847 RepID=A0A1X6X7R1_9MICO|nr:type I restriction endonuclease [Brachybacterium nesterenkovii]SLM95225.1 Type I restriction-modification system, restriction subunit R [Brachybacterium nesterenkovii]